MLKKLFLVSLISIFMTTSVLASSYNSFSKSTAIIRDQASIAFIDLVIEPKNEVETGSSIFLNFENAIVFEQDVIDGTSNGINAIGYNKTGYQYILPNGKYWDTTTSFYDVMPSLNTAQLPYHLKKINDKQLQVDLINLPDVYADNSLSDVNGVGRNPYYSIPLVAYADGIGEVTLSIDSNYTSISENINAKIANIYNGPTSATEATTETTTISSNSEATETTTASAANTQTTTAESKKVDVQIGSDTITVDGRTVAVDVPAYIQTSSQSTMIPLRIVSEAFGGDDSVAWDSNTKTATVKYNGTTVSFTSGSNVYIKNGEEVGILMSSGVQAEIKDGRMFVPFRALGEALGLDVSWEPNSKTASYSSR